MSMKEKITTFTKQSTIESVLKCTKKITDWVLETEDCNPRHANHREERLLTMI